MGKTTRTYREEVQRFEDDWKTYRSWLRHREQPAFDQLVKHARDRADAGGQQNPTTPEWAILVSMLVGQQREIEELRGRVDELEGDGE